MIVPLKLIKLVKMVTETVAGSGGNVTMNSDGGMGGLQYTRSFKILFFTPQSITSADWDLQLCIGVGLGDYYPSDSYAVCTKLDIKPDGDSRLVWIATAEYSPAVGATVYSATGENNNPNSNDPNSKGDETPDEGGKPPDQRLANWWTSTSTIETPTWVWIPFGQLVPVFARNPANDMYDGLTILQPIVTITVEQYFAGDQTVFSSKVGMVNSNQGNLGALNMFPRSTLFKSISFKPHAETFGRKRWRGWMATLEFSYKPNYNNYIALAVGNANPMAAYLGWDIAVPVTGMNCINGRLNANDVDNNALTLRRQNDDFGTIAGWPNNVAIEPTLVGQKCPANILIAAPGASRASQRPAGMPIPLNMDGTPRSPNANPPVIVQRCQVYDSFDFNNLGLRLRS